MAQPAALLPTATQLTLECFRYQGSANRRESFDRGNGFGPFTVQRTALRSEILAAADPGRSFHISGSKGAGKTILLELLGDDLILQGKSVYFFEASTDIDLVRPGIEAMIAKKEEAYLLIDETQLNVNSAVFIQLLKNDVSHRITTIGAGVPAFESFSRKIKTNRLFLTDQDLVTEGMIQYFVGDVTDTTVRQHIELLLREILSYVGGHIYPLLRLAELLVPQLKQEGQTSAQAITTLNSSSFRATEEFQDLSARISPALAGIDIRAVFQPQQYHLSPAVVELTKRGFCDDNGKVVSMLLFDLYLNEIGSGRASPVTTLSGGVTGVQELLSFGTPTMDWSHYEPHGGAVEDALTFMLLQGLSSVRPLGVMLFNPKLVTAGTASRRPDIYFNSTIHSYLECVLTKANTQTARTDVEKHILRFFRKATISLHTMKFKTPVSLFCTTKIGGIVLCN